MATSNNTIITDGYGYGHEYAVYTQEATGKTTTIVKTDKKNNNKIICNNCTNDFSQELMQKYNIKIGKEINVNLLFCEDCFKDFVEKVVLELGLEKNV